MKKYLLIALAGFIGCASMPCPKEDIVTLMVDPGTGHSINAIIEKGVFDEPDNYMTLEEFNRRLRERRMH